jgi:phage regulator Rha-like protein
MLTGSRLIEVTAAFVRRFANLEGLMHICDEPAIFDRVLAEAIR